MSNITNNRVSAQLDPQALDAVRANINAIRQQMPFLVGLTVEERVTMPKINEANKIFVEDCVNVMQNNGEFLPAYLDVAEVQRDLTLFSQLDAISVQLEKLLEQINDTKMLAGSEAFGTSLAAYRLFAAAAKAGLPGADSAYDRLKARFAQQGGGVAE